MYTGTKRCILCSIYLYNQIYNICTVNSTCTILYPYRIRAYELSTRQIQSDDPTLKYNIYLFIHSCPCPPPKKKIKNAVLKICLKYCQKLRCFRTCLWYREKFQIFKNILKIPQKLKKNEKIHFFVKNIYFFIHSIRSQRYKD